MIIPQDQLYFHSDTHDAYTDIAVQAVKTYGAAQDPDEFAWLMRRVKPRAVVEIGFSAGSLWAWSQLGRVVGIDLMHYAPPPYIAHVPAVTGDSHSPITKVQALAKLDMDPELVFIDGNHAYESVKADFELWRDTAPFIAFHDIYTNFGMGEDVSFFTQAWKFWADIKDSYTTEECVVDHSTACGIGLVVNP